MARPKIFSSKAEYARHFYEHGYSGIQRIANQERRALFGGITDTDLKPFKREYWDRNIKATNIGVNSIYDEGCMV